MLRAAPYAPYARLCLALILAACSNRLDLGHNRSASAPGSDFTGSVIDLAYSKGSAKGLAVDANTIYWAATAAHEIMVTAKDGSETVGIPTPDGAPYRVAATDTTVYFTSNVGGYVGALDKASRVVSLLISGESYPESIEVATDGVY